MRLARRARNILRRNGIEVSRYFAELDWERNFLRQLQSHRVSAVLDVGANSGQYARGLRGAGFAGRIVSFEPLPGPFAVLQRSASTDPLWECRRCALGDVDGTISINVAGNEGASSSVLPMLKRHQDAFPPANYVGRPTGADTSTRFRGCRRSAAQRYCVLEDRRSRIREAGDRGWRFNGARPMRRHAARAVFPAVVRGWHAHPRGARSRGFVGLYALGIATRFHRPPQRSNAAGRWHLLPGQRLTRRRVNLFRHSREDVFPESTVVGVELPAA